MTDTPTPQPELTQEFIDKFKPKATVNIKLRNYAGHPGQTALCTTKLKRIIVRAGRRGGKTTGAATKALLAFLQGKRVLYAAPTLDQVQKFWKEVKKALDEALAYQVYKKNETEHWIEKQGSEQRIRAKTAWNAETLRGDYADLLILDEWQMMDETAWTEVGAPMLIDNNGDVLFIYTPPSLETKSASKASDPQHAAKMFKQHKNDPLWLCIHFASAANPHISEAGLEEVSRNMTALAYRQEILAEDTEEIPGALWTRKILEDSRVTAVPCELRRIVVAIDPSGGNTTEVGIGAAGEGMDGHIYVLRDSSMKAARPKDWAQRAIQLYYELLADRIIGERNYGGDMVEETLRNVDENVSYHDVNASRGKLVRAEPVLALFQQNKMHLVGHFPELEEELCSYTAAPGQKSPNRLDWMVWAGIELTGQGSLGLLDLFKSGRVAKLANAKLAAAGSLAAVMTNDKTPKCEHCQAVTLAVLSRGPQFEGGIEYRCQNCGMQQPKPKIVALGGRRISLENS
jgi:ATP:corrinoid adenosyltransferase